MVNITVRPEEKWAKFKKAVIESAKTILGLKKRSIKTGLTKTIKPFKNYLAEKRAAFIDWQNHPNCVARRDKFKERQARAQRELRAMQDAWWEEKAEEIQRYADTKRTKQLCDAIKTIYGPSRRGSAPLLSADGSTMNKEKEGFLARWQEHFSQLLHRPSVVDQTSLHEIPDQRIQDDLDLPPSEEDVRTAINQMSCGKAPGRDGIPTEIFKALGPAAFSTFLKS